MSNSIVISGDYVKIQSKVAGSATIKPGMLLKQSSATQLIEHATSGGFAEKMVALEDALQGDLKTDTYTLANVVDAAIFLPGSRCQVIVEAGADIDIGDLLMSNGDG